MPEPNFEQIARRIVDQNMIDWGTARPGRVVHVHLGDYCAECSTVAAIVVQLRQVWNARGAADLAAVRDAPAFDGNTVTTDVEDAIRSLDR